VVGFHVEGTSAQVPVPVVPDPMESGPAAPSSSSVPYLPPALAVRLMIPEPVHKDKYLIGVVYVKLPFVYNTSVTARIPPASRAAINIHDHAL
jgi:hypothetical protein